MSSAAGKHGCWKTPSRSPWPHTALSCTFTQRPLALPAGKDCSRSRGTESTERQSPSACSLHACMFRGTQSDLVQPFCSKAGCLCFRDKSGDPHCHGFEELEDLGSIYKAYLNVGKAKGIWYRQLQPRRLNLAKQLETEFYNGECQVAVITGCATKAAHRGTVLLSLPQFSYHTTVAQPFPALDPYIRSHTYAFRPEIQWTSLDIDLFFFSFLIPNNTGSQQKLAQFWKEMIFLFSSAVKDSAQCG